MTGPQWGELSPADFDRRRVAKGYKPADPDQSALLFVAAPTAPAKPGPAPEILPGQEPLFGSDEL